jgi:hypothetical protein
MRRSAANRFPTFLQRSTKAARMVCPDLTSGVISIRHVLLLASLNATGVAANHREPVALDLIMRLPRDRRFL